MNSTKHIWTKHLVTVSRLKKTTFTAIYLHQQECQFEVTPRQDVRYHVRALHALDDVWTRFFGAEDWEDSAAGPSQGTYLAESSGEMSAECSRWLMTLTKNKTKRSVHRRSQESNKSTRKSSTVESTYWRFFTSQVYWLTLHVTTVLYCSLDSH